MNPETFYREQLGQDTKIISDSFDSMIKLLWHAEIPAIVVLSTLEYCLYRYKLHVFESQQCQEKLND